MAQSCFDGAQPSRSRPSAQAVAWSGASSTALTGSTNSDDRSGPSASRAARSHARLPRSGIPMGTSTATAAQSASPASRLPNASGSARHVTPSSPHTAATQPPGHPSTPATVRTGPSCPAHRR